MKSLVLILILFSSAFVAGAQVPEPDPGCTNQTSFHHYRADGRQYHLRFAILPALAPYESAFSQIYIRDSLSDYSIYKDSVFSGDNGDGSNFKRPKTTYPWPLSIWKM